MGRKIYSDAKELLIMADGGGSNGSRNRLWKSELQKLADELGLEITICHFPPGTSKWNKIEHRMFSCISQNWSGRPLTDHQTVVDLIGNTTTKSGLKIECELDKNHYPTGKKISDEQFHELSIKKNSFRNYSGIEKSQQFSLKTDQLVSDLGPPGIEKFRAIDLLHVLSADWDHRPTMEESNWSGIEKG